MIEIVFYIKGEKMEKLYMNMFHLSFLNHDGVSHHDPFYVIFIKIMS